MRANEILTERASRSHPIIIVDVQPAYGSTPTARRDGYTGATTIAPGLMNFLNDQTGSVLAYYNGAGEGLTEDEEYDVQNYFVENGLDENKIQGIQFVEKTYGFFRTWIDYDVDTGLIIKILRKMNEQRVRDSRELVPELEQIMGDKYQDFMDDDPVYFPDIDVAQLKSMSGALLCGGGKHECLKEIRLLMSVYNIRYKLAQDFIYG